HSGYRRERMEAFERLLAEHAVDGIWLDYHHAHASWEQAVPEMPDTCFCKGCLERFEVDTGTPLHDRSTPELAALLLGHPQLRPRWIRWRCDLFTDWVREFRAVLDR